MTGFTIMYRSSLKLIVSLLLLLGGRSAFALVLTNVTVANVTPSSFSVVWATSPGVTPAITVYGDSAGASNLSGQVGVEWFPLHTGDPTLTNAYYARQHQSALQQAAINQGLVQVRISKCLPGTTYYYSVQVTDTNNQTIVSPASGPLPSVTTATENDFVTESRQLVITVPGLNSAGSIVTLSSSNTPSVLAAVVGDGAASNEVYFDVSDLLAASGQTNYLPQGAQSFTAKVLGASARNVSQIYSLNFTGNFLVGQEQQFIFSQRLALTLGSSVVQAGQSGSLPISLNTAGISNLSFVLNLPTNLFSSITLQTLSPQVSAAVLQSVGSNSLMVSFVPVNGQILQGNQQLAQIAFTTISNQSSAFVNFLPESVQAVNADGSTAVNSLVQRGRVVIIGPQPLLESMITTAGARQLALYGIPGDSYQIQSSTDLTNPNSWTNVQRVPLTNQVELLSGLDTSKAAIYYRAYQFTSLAPVMDVLPSVGGQQTFVVYGTPWSAYQLEYATSLVPPNWKLLSRVPMTNAFSFFHGLSAGSPNVFYRSSLLNADPPILEPQLANQNRSLLIYGLAGTNYGLQYATNVSKTVTWFPLLNYKLTNSFQTISNLTGTNPAIFYRLKKQ